MGEPASPSLRARARTIAYYRKDVSPIEAILDQDLIAIEELQALLTRYSRPISETITKAYRQTWPPEGLTVQICAYANWAGAYSTSGRLIVTASTDDGMAASEGPETVSTKPRTCGMTP